MPHGALLTILKRCSPFKSDSKIKWQERISPSNSALMWNLHVFVVIKNDFIKILILSFSKMHDTLHIAFPFSHSMNKT